MSEGESFEKKKSTLLIWENGTMQLLEFGKLNSLLNLYGTDSTILSELIFSSLNVPNNRGNVLLHINIEESVKYIYEYIHIPWRKD